MVISDLQPSQADADRELGYYTPLNAMDVEWLASEVRMLQERVASEQRGRRESERRTFERETNLRHVIAHEIADRMFAWKLGKHATAGAMRALDAVHPISRCDTGCAGRVS